MTPLPFTPTRPLPETEDDCMIKISFPILGSGSNSSCGQVVVLTLDRPSKLNAVNVDDMQALWTFLEWIDEQRQISITILTGKGRFFSAGANFSDPGRTIIPDDMADFDENHSRHQSASRKFLQGRVASTNGSAMRTLFNHSKLLVASLNGPAVGIMACAVVMCDLIFATSDFYLHTPFPQLALIAEAGSTVTFPEKLGLARAQKALIEGKKLEFKELQDAGFITHLIDVPKTSNDKNLTAPILEKTLQHISDSLLPPAIDTHALITTARILRQSTFERSSIIESHAKEIAGAEYVFRSGKPQQQFARLASGGRHKL